MIITDETIAEKIAGLNPDEALDVFIHLMRDVASSEEEAVFMAGHSRLFFFCLQCPEDIARIGERAVRLGATCEIVSIEPADDRCLRHGTQTCHILLVRPESPAYQIIFSEAVR